MPSQYVSLYRQTLADRQRRYDAAIASNEYTPFLYPWDTLPVAYLFLALAIAPRLPPRLARAIRYLAFILIVAHTLYLYAHRRTLWFAGGYGLGLSGHWGIIMAAALLIFNDPAQSFRRLETRPAKTESKESQPLGSAQQFSSNGSASVDLRKRKVPGVYTSTDIKQPPFDGSDKPATRLYTLVWQGFPHGKGLLHTIDWIVDLTTSFRGPNWSHRISTLGAIDGPVPADAGGGPRTEKYDCSKATAVPKRSLRALQAHAMQDFVVAYLLLDLLKTTMVTDPYFLGLMPLESPASWPWLSALSETVPVATRFVRLSMSMAGVISALTFIFSLSPLFFTVLLPCLVDVSKITKSPLLEPWMYGPFWYPLTTSVLHTGLAGFWGKFWHQMFRFGISEPSRVIIDRLNIDKRGNAARVIQLLVAFGLSGSIHAAGSYTTFSIVPSRPFSGPMLFFLTQATGSLVQSFMVKSLYKYATQAKSLPRATKQTANLLFVLGFLYFTGPLLADDFARCGLWLFEPVPISFLRGLGFGPGGMDEGWWTWYQEGSRTVGWHQGDRWWNSGIAIY
ncbi:hypothetical protein LTR06_003520 [Exophiala xenobiotica]|nr:hypothetical protein LTR06_003520 [Exophiala xenobiotica]